MTKLETVTKKEKPLHPFK